MSAVMTSSDETVVPLSKSKVVLLIVGAVAFVALGLWLFQLDSAWIESQRRFNNPALVHAIGLATIVFFGLCGVVAIKKLFDSKPGLVLSSAGMLVNSSADSVGLIPWSDVEGFGTYELHKQRLLVVKLVAPDKYVLAGGPLRQALRRANMRMVGSPIAISANTLKISFDELVKLCSTYRETYARGRRG
jgi:hypothetical protein